METFKSFESKLYEVNGSSFDDIALEVFHFQAIHNKVYNDFLQNLHIDIAGITTVKDIPFLPISFFKTHDIRSGAWREEVLFTSSGTTGIAASKHPVPSLGFYHDHARRCFEFFFGSLKNFHFLALLPSYMERQGSSLISMMHYFIKESHSRYSRFYLYDTERLLKDIDKLRHDKKKTILWGVSFALLDLAEKNDIDLSHCMIFETGGMKGRRREITRSEMHEILQHHLNASEIYSEYGMTELLSQAYTSGGDRFKCPPWMKVSARDITDPFRRGIFNETGALNIIDLANWRSISFIETEDLGKVDKNEAFEVLGRLDNSDIRGCNLLIA